MKITHFDIFRYKLRLKQPLTVRGITHEDREGLLIRLEGSNDPRKHTGWGEIAPLPVVSEESLEDALHAVVRLKSAVTGLAIPDHLEELSGQFEHWLGESDLPPSVRCGFEFAVLSLIAKSLNKSVACLLSDSCRHSVFVNGLIIQSGNDLSEQVAQLPNSDYQAVKIKVSGMSPDQAINFIRQIHKTLPNTTSLRLDANQCWSFDDACKFAQGIAPDSIEYIEEPLDDSSRLAELARFTGLPVALDESLLGTKPESLTAFDGLKAIVIHPMLSGGPELTMRFARRAHQLNIKPIIASSFESVVGIAALINLAAATNLDDTPVGLDTLSMFRSQPIKGQIETPVISSASATSFDPIAMSKIADDVDINSLVFVKDHG
ncbi:MAG: o-succinylbenzoate synthase [candidate division Zixibacteria bacterium]